MSEQKIAEWLVMYGTEVSTAYQVAGLFLQGLQDTDGSLGNYGSSQNRARAAVSEPAQGQGGEREPT